MINTSTEYKNYILQDRGFTCVAKITLSDGTVLEVSSESILSQGFEFTEGVSGNGAFDIGAAIINKFTLVFDNTDMQYSGYDFTEAVIRPTIGLQLSSTVETFKKGVFTVDSAKTPGDTIKITALDNMSKFEKDYDSVLTYPATLGEIVRDACTNCGVTLNTPNFDNVNYKVAERPTAAMTYLSVISYAAQLAGCYARCNYNGHLELKWYDFSAFETTGNLDGGHFYDYTSGDTADGGDFSNYGAGFSYDAGSGFGDRDGYHHISKVRSQDICLDDVVITGIRAKEYSESSEDAVEYTFGAEGYVLGISDNPFIQGGEAGTVATFLGNKIVGTRVRPLAVSAQCDPSVEAGDMAYVSDRRGRSHRCCITNLSFSVGGSAIYSCDAETPSRNNADSYSATTAAIVKARQQTKIDLTAYEKSVQQLTELLGNSLGYYTTIEYDDSGAMISYMHDKPALDESKIIWKKTVESFGVSVDGGKTYAAGVTADGSATLKTLIAVGITADWIVAGMIRSKDGSSYWDLDGGAVYLKGTFTTESQGFRTEVTAGNSTYYYNNDYVGTLGAAYWGSGQNNKGLNVRSAKNFVSFGTSYGAIDAATVDYVINNGLNPTGLTQKHIFFGNTNLVGTLYISTIRPRTSSGQITIFDALLYVPEAILCAETC